MEILNDKTLNSVLKTTKDVVFYGTLLIGFNIMITEGFNGIAKHFVKVSRKLPGVENALQSILHNEVKSAKKLLNPDQHDHDHDSFIEIPIPEQGLTEDQVLLILEKLKSKETAAQEGKSFAYTYTTSSDLVSLARTLSQAYEIFTEGSILKTQNHETLLKKTWNLFMHTNALNPMLYPSLRRLETEVVAMTAWMLHGGNQAVGSVTSGGTESILMAVKAYRERAAKLMPHISKPNMICCITIHPAFEKAAHYFGVKIIHVPTTSDMRMDMSAVRAAINSNTILLVGSASQYCHGVIDPIESLSSLALSLNIPLHVDACFGGFMLPWLERLGHPLPLWDFRLPGVTSISADIHKYGYSSKGASVIVYRNRDYRYYQYFAYSEWPGGLFASPSMAGTRPGGLISQAWAALVSLGQDGYLKVARTVLETTQRFKRIVQETEGIELVAEPDMTALAIKGVVPISILAVADVMEQLGGWKIERQGSPDSIHLSVMPQHAQPGVVERFQSDLQAAVNKVRSDPSLSRKGTTGVYGMVAIVPDKGIINDFLIKFFNSLFVPDKKTLISEYLK